MRQGSDSHDRNRRSNLVRASSAIIRNTAWNFLGTILPILLAVITVPVLIYSIGTQRFGVLAIAWAVLGYFGLFDLGLGGATTKFLAEALAHGRIAEGRALFWTSLIFNATLGLIGAFVLAVLSPLLVGSVLNIPVEIQAEALGAFYLVACSVPLVTLLETLQGALEAQHRFGLLNVLQIPTSTLTQAAPLLVLPFTYNLSWIVGAMVLGRLLSVVVFFVAAVRQLESPFGGPFFLRKRLGSLLSYGSWLSVTKAVDSLLIYADRFIIGSLSSMSAVAYYTVPYAAVTRLSVLPESLTRTMFPIFSAETEPGRRTRLYSNATKYLALVLAPCTATVIAFTPELLRLWVGEDFAQNSTAVMQILAVGVFLNSLAMIPYILIQGLGRPDITAKFHLLETPFYLLLLWYGLLHWGIAGAAVAWTVRAGVDALLLAFYVRLNNYLSPPPSVARLRWTLTFALLLVLGGWLLYELVDDLILKVGIWGLLSLLASFVVWQKLLTSEEQDSFTNYVKSISARMIAGSSPTKTGDQTDE
jgi:O-antigen/teichoic acid export membrane protein